MVDAGAVGGDRTAASPGAELEAGARRTIPLLSYDVVVAPGLLDTVGDIVARVAQVHTLVLITDEHVNQLLGDRVQGALQAALPGARTIRRAIPPGERFKTRESWSALTDWMLAERCGRDSAVIALGGGVVGDLAGFVAATYMRGIPFVQLPTSLLAMVDASVGGKVGVDTAAGKNLVGAFHQPDAVLIDPLALRSLPHAHRRAGMAEVLKHGIIADARYLRESMRLGPQIVDGAHDGLWEGAALTALIARSVEIKADVVREDERERGRRQVLNFGHTIGHAVEAATDFSLLHGEAVAIGMVLESRLAESLGTAERGTAAQVVEAMLSVGLPTRLPAGLSPDDLLARMVGDKKARRGEVVMALPMKIGTMAGYEDGYGITVASADVTRILKQERAS